MPVTVPGTALYELQLETCRTCPFYAGDPSKVTDRVTMAIAGALTGESGKCLHCGCPVASRAAVGCPIGRF
jgi:hypothetical protein